MKQKIVIKVSMKNNDKCRSKAMKIAVGVSGVDSVALIGDEKDHLQVLGAGIDSVQLTRLLRKKMPAEIVSVEEDKEKDPPKVEAPTPPPYVVGWHAPPYYGFPGWRFEGF